MPASAMIGHNNPPSTVDRAKEAFAELGEWLKDRPVIQSAEDAKHGAAFIERTRVALSEMETERQGKVKPLNEQLSEINSGYRVARDPLENLLKTLRKRLTDYANAVEAARIVEANRLREEAEAKEAAARAAEAAEKEALADAEQGICTDIGGAVAEADQAFADFQRAGRKAAVAERSVPVRFSSVMGGRTQTMRTTEVLTVTDAFTALKAMGLTEELKDAFLSAARKYRKAYDELPAGITSTFERSL